MIYTKSSLTNYKTSKPKKKKCLIAASQAGAHLHGLKKKNTLLFNVKIKENKKREKSKTRSQRKKWPQKENLEHN
jgi:hypothetical protein